MRPKQLIIVAAVIAVAVLPLFAIAIFAGLVTVPALAKLAGGLAALPLAIGAVLKHTDKDLQVTGALPDGAATTATTGIDLGHSADGDFLVGNELTIEAPALTTGELGDADTITYDVYHDTASDFSGESALYSGVLVQTGAGGAGAAAAEVSVSLPPGVNRYVRVKATNSAAGDASGKSVTATLRVH